MKDEYVFIIIGIGIFKLWPCLFHSLLNNALGKGMNIVSYGYGWNSQADWGPLLLANSQSKKGKINPLNPSLCN